MLICAYKCDQWNMHVHVLFLRDSLPVSEHSMAASTIETRVSLVCFAVSMLDSFCEIVNSILTFVHLFPGYTTIDERVEVLWVQSQSLHRCLLLVGTTFRGTMVYSASALL